MMAGMPWLYLGNDELRFVPNEMLIFWLKAMCDPPLNHDLNPSLLFCALYHFFTHLKVMLMALHQPLLNTKRST